MPRCGFCGHLVATAASVKRHIQRTPTCCYKWNLWLQAPQNHLSKIPTSTHHFLGDPFEHMDPGIAEEPEVTSPRPSKRARVEDANAEHGLDDGLGSTKTTETSQLFTRHYPSKANAGAPLKSVTKSCPFEKQRVVQEDNEQGPYSPFRDEREWDLAQWLMNSLKQNQIDEYLKLPITRERSCLSFHNKYTFLKKIDELPTGPSWTCEMVPLAESGGSSPDTPDVDELELWKRDAGECIRELFQNPAFRDHMAYAPQEIYKDEGCTKHVYSEMANAEWWWEKQGSLPAGATIAPVIIALDKTHLSNFRGDKSAWPVYLTVGNIDKETRHQPSAHATILLGYIPVSKLAHLPENERLLEGYRLFHYCMRRLLEPLYAMGREGLDMLCPDGQQCLLACCKENRCPRCTVDANARGDNVQSPLHGVPETLEALKQHERSGESEHFKKEGLRPVYSPFWEGLPHCDFFSCFTPDILHQLHKGVFKDHLVSWCMAILGSEEIDACFKSLSEFPGLRRFKNGISTVSQWTGSEHKTMEKVFIGILGPHANARLLKVARALIDFIYLAQLQTHTTDTLAALKSSLDDFHRNKEILEQFGIREHFNIPKIHSMIHYVASIRSRGAADRFNSEAPERLHIDYAKEAYRASNKRDYTAQMMLWLQRQEAVVLCSSYLDWIRERRARMDRNATRPVSGESDCEDEDQDSDTGSDDQEERTVQLSMAPSVPMPTLLPRYQVAMKSPKGYQDLLVNQLEERFHATNFLPAFSTFIEQRLPRGTIRPSHFDRFDCYRRVTLFTPAHPHVTTGTKFAFKSTLWATPPSQNLQARVTSRRAHFDTAFIMESTSDSTQVCVGRLRAIFDLPPQFWQFPTSAGIRTVVHTFRTTGPKYRDVQDLSLDPQSCPQLLCHRY
ncbi:hypothetical protein EVG20_g7943 [Dentipellis fragilis]|uniref:CxC2-like cysteine cluster KDZ transposase-associated domain-containing protein n=1 Tax=Dentipellis fragilis TaxID=205917 RepID=A0A4Y9YC21_9AGAM|nr:hypothetical protein EVG20_g7943 [Dentipellis fragilis]